MGSRRIAVVPDAAQAPAAATIAAPAGMPFAVAPRVAAVMLGTSKLCSAEIAVIGAVVLVGSFALPELTVARAGFEAMKPNTAALLVVFAAGMWSCRRAASVRARRASLLAVVFATTLTGAEYLLGVDLGIDQLLVRDGDAGAVLASGRMSPLTTLGLCLLGSALLFVEKQRRASDIAALLAGGIALSSGCGYLFDAIVSIDHHGVMQSRQLRDDASKTALSGFQNRVAAIALIHEQLYQAQDYARVPFSKYATRLAENIFHLSGASPGNVELRIDVERLSLAVDRAIPCGLILNELITNAPEHAFPHDRHGTLRIEIRRDGAQHVLLVVADDGVGMAEPSEPAKPRSLGVRIVSTLLEQLEGQLEVVRAGGTTFRMRFPAEVEA